MTDIQNELERAAQEDARRIARLTFEQRGNKGFVRLSEHQFSNYLAVSFEPGVEWARKQLRRGSE